MEKSGLLEKVVEVFSGWKEVKIGRDLDNAYVSMKGVSFAILHSKKFVEAADVLRVPVFRTVFGGVYVEEYKKSLKELSKSGYKVRKYGVIGPHLLRTVT